MVPKEEKEEEATAAPPVEEGEEQKVPVAQELVHAEKTEEPGSPPEEEVKSECKEEAQEEGSDQGKGPEASSEATPEGVLKAEKKEGGGSKMAATKGSGAPQDSDSSATCSADEVDEPEGGDKSRSVSACPPCVHGCWAPTVYRPPLPVLGSSWSSQGRRLGAKGPSGFHGCRKFSGECWAAGVTAPPLSGGPLWSLQQSTTHSGPQSWSKVWTGHVAPLLPGCALALPPSARGFLPHSSPCPSFLLIRTPGPAFGLGQLQGDLILLGHNDRTPHVQIRPLPQVPKGED